MEGERDYTQIQKQGTPDDKSQCNYKLMNDMEVNKYGQNSKLSTNTT